MKLYTKARNDELKIVFLFANFISSTTCVCVRVCVQLMSHVRLPLVCREFLMSCVESESLIREDSQCKELLLEAMKYHLLPEQRSLMTTQRTSERRPAGMRPYVFAVGE